jgi:hypothetical protein
LFGHNNTSVIPQAGICDRGGVHGASLWSLIEKTTGKAFEVSMTNISLLGLAKSDGVNTASGIAQKLGAKWPPPPTISIRNLVRCRPNFQWTNYEQTQTETPFSLCTPDNVNDLVAIIRNAEASGRRVHALGSGWSFSDCAMTTDVMVDTHFLNRTINKVQQALNGTQPPFLYHIEAGISIHDLYTALDQNGDPATGERLGLETMGGASGQTLAGAISTGTHGGNLFIGPIADSVLAIHLVGAGGVQYWIEPTASITDKSALQKFVVPDIALENIIYDDNWFNAVLVSVGCMGIIYAVVLRVRPQYFLIETTTASTWQNFKQNAAAQLSDRTFQFLQLAINPYPDANGNNFALITNRKESSVDPATLNPPIPVVSAPTQVTNALLGLCADLLANIASNPLGSGFDAVKVIVESMVQAIQTGNISDISKIATNALIQLVNNICSDAPELRPILMTDYSKVMAAAWPPATVGDISFKVMDASRFRPSLGPSNRQPLTVDPTGGYSIELFFPTQVLGGTPPVPYYIGFIDELIKLVNAATGTFLLGYVGVRFTGQTRAFLGMQQWDQTCSVEISTLPNVNGEWTLLSSLLDLIYYYPKGNALPLPHWGQLIDLNIRGYGDRYPDYAKWQQVYASLSNNFIQRTFENALSDRWQLTYPPSYMSVDAKFVGKSVTNQVTLLITVTDTTTAAPVAGVQIQIYEEAFPSPRKTAGITGADGRVQVTYLQCLDPETKTPMECAGLARKERYQDMYFVTPYQ